MCCIINVALKKPTYQGQGTMIAYNSNRNKRHKAVDGIEADKLYVCTHTTNTTLTWWMIDLLAVYKIRSLTVLNSEEYGNCLSNFTVDIVMTDHREEPGFPETPYKICAC